MDYTMAVKYINEKNKLGSVPGLDNVKELLRRLGNPQNKCRCLHIAGTNGKGSVFSFVQEILIEAGYSVGRYISPTVFCYLERFQINKFNMSEDDFARLLTVVADKVEEMTEDGFNSPTAFEIETALSFVYFLDKRVDYVLVECGMGGELDATNVIDRPMVSVIASISMDHMQVLGDTLEKIAVQKVGIIKEDSVCVSSPQAEEVMKVIEKRCDSVGAELKTIDEKDLDIIKMEIGRTVFSYMDEQYEITLMGEHQVTNAVTAIETVRQLKKNHVGISEQNIKAGLKKTQWKGRMSKMNDSPLMFVDGAHNEQAWKLLKKAVNKYFTNRKIIYIIGVLRDKEYNKLVDILGDTMKYAVTVTPDSPRALDKETMAELIASRGIPVTTAESSHEAKNIAFKNAKNDDVIIVCGSLSFLADYLRI